MRIAIIGNYGATNVGDNAILRTILKSHPHHSFVVFSASPKETHQSLNVESVHVFPLGFRSIFKYGFRPSVNALRSVDAVIFGGGGLMQDYYLYACFLWAWQIFWVKLFNKPYFIYATGVGPLRTWWGRFLTRYIYRDAVGITVRDEQSFQTLKNLRLSTRNIEVTADPVFLFSAPHTELADSRHSHTYLISLRPWLKYNKRIIDAFTSFLLKLKNERQAKFIFVCMQQIKERDLEVIEPVLKRVGGQLAAPAHFGELVRLMKQSEFAIGMRYHFLLAALVTHTPALAISYSHKVDSLFKGGSLEPYHLPLAELSADTLSKKVTRLSVDYNNVKIYQKKHLEKQQELAKKNIGFFEGFVKLLTNDEDVDRITELN